MDVTRSAAATVAVLLGGAVLALTSRVAAVPHDFLAVNTQFSSSPSEVVDAAGVFSGCRRVDELDSAVTDDGSLRFTGEKRLTCAAGARVRLRYDVAFDAGTGATTGTWRVIASTLPGIEVGDRGALVGDPGGCTVSDRACGCILDRFTLAA